MGHRSSCDRRLWRRLGCLLLLLRKSAAYYFFVASLPGVVVTPIHTLGVARSVDFNPFEFVMMILMSLVVAALLIWYSKRSESNCWISQEPIGQRDDVVCVGTFRPRHTRDPRRTHAALRAE